jgi:spermidine/putrescine transport system permease protein
MIGNLIQQKFFDGQNWPLGCALTVALMLLLFLIMTPYLRQSRKAES